MRAYANVWVLVAVACTGTSAPAWGDRSNPGMNAEVQSGALDTLQAMRSDSMAGATPLPKVGETSSCAPLRTPPAEPFEGYAGGAPWYLASQPIEFQGFRYGPYGPERLIAPTLLERIGEYRSVPIFTEVDQPAAEIIYVPVRPGCVFRQYNRVSGM